MKPKTQKEINTEIKALEACKAYAPKFTMFGDNNHAVIDEQILALENDLTEDDAYDEYGGDMLSSVCQAIAWREGEEEESPSSGWDNFKTRK